MILWGVLNVPCAQEGAMLFVCGRMLNIVCAHVVCVQEGAICGLCVAGCCLLLVH